MPIKEKNTTKVQESKFGLKEENQKKVIHLKNQYYNTFFFPAVVSDMWDLSSLNRERTHGPLSGSVES